MVWGSLDAELLHAVAKGARFETQAIRRVAYSLDPPVAVLKDAYNVHPVDVLQIAG